MYIHTKDGSSPLGQTTFRQSSSDIRSVIIPPETILAAGSRETDRAVSPCGIAWQSSVHGDTAVSHQLSCIHGDTAVSQQLSLQIITTPM